MTNTKFRKRALLSSVAMLLVALVALGSATFAWYQAKIDVDADGMKMTTTAAPGLLVASLSEMGGTFNSSYTYHAAADLTAKATAQSLQPASYDQASNKFYTTTGTGPSVITAKSGQAIQTTTNYITDTIYFKLDAGQATGSEKVHLKSVTINAGSDDDSTTQALLTTLANAARVVVTQANGTFIGEYAISAATEAYYKANATDSTKGDRSEGAGNTKSISAAVTTLNEECCAVTANAVAAQSVVVYLYLDGEATGVTTNNAKQINNAKDIISSVQFNFSL